ncbi:uncharacterized protein JCM10292_005524 [Rhodotorula paludigena]|uniref:uncharacterized protein n=1 Tax=Rhodotorula paludigena TaxID=86838 RepID=UPI00317C15FA
MDPPFDSPDAHDSRDDYLEYGQHPTLPLLPGTYTLLPLVDACDNVQLPPGPWSGHDCKRRWDEHVVRQSRTNSLRAGLAEATEPAAAATESALADDDDEEDEGAPAAGPADFDQEFLVPFFVALPPPPPNMPGTPARRRSSVGANSTRASFSRMTPLPRLRSSSPTPSASSFTRARADPSTAATAQPIGFLRPAVLRALIDDNRKLVAMNCKPVWAFQPPIHFPPPVRRPSYGSSRPASRRGSRSASMSGANGIAPLSSATPDGAATPAADPAAVAEGALQLDDVLEGLKALSASGARGHVSGVAGPWAVGFEDWVNEEGAETRREHMDRLVRGWKHMGLFPECLGGWRDEQYTIYGPAPPPSPDGDDNPLQTGSNEAFRMERSACALFGFATFGVHCTAFVEEDGEPIKLWVPRRSATKQTWPSYLDNTVAGGITAGDSPRQSIIRECAEEASLSPAFVAPRIKQAGVITYQYRTVDGFLQPEVQYVYDLRLPPPSQEGAAEMGAVPTTNPADGEVESFELMSLEDVVEKMVAGEFKPNCALVLLDFFIRHGYLTTESDTRFLEIASRLHRPLGLPGPA